MSADPAETAGATSPAGGARRRRSSCSALRWLVAAAVVAKLGVAAAGARTAVAESGAGARSAAGPSVAAPSAAATTAEAKGATAPSAAAGVARRAEDRPRAGDLHALLTAIAERQAQLEARTKELDAREERLQLFESDVTKKLERLEEIQKQLQSEVDGAAAGADQAAASLAKVYGTMRPAQAAPILEQLDDATVLRILTRMKEKEVGQILPLMARERAIVLTRSLSTSGGR